MRLGIDFGTTRTVVASSVDGRYPITVFETPRGYTEFVPGLAVRGGQDLALGWDAVSELGPKSLAVIRSIKREASSRLPDDRLADLGIDRTALELTADYLRFLRRMLLERSNLELDPSEPLEAMVAVPANAGTSQRYLTVEAFTRAGFRVLGLINEPTAAAIEYAHNNLTSIGKRSPKRYVVVYDLGLALREANVSPDGLNRLVTTTLLELCREAKEALSPSSRRLLIDLGACLPGAEAVQLDMAEVNAACQPLVTRTLGRRRHGVPAGRQAAARGVPAQGADRAAASRCDRRGPGNRGRPRRADLRAGGGHAPFRRVARGRGGAQQDLRSDHPKGRAARERQLEYRAALPPRARRRSPALPRVQRARRARAASR
jgi:molecular chaperone DnaK (HSP70)